MKNLKNSIRNSIILGIETSCDDTCIAVLKVKNGKIKILSNIVSSQVKLHAKYGGVYPFLARREHQKNLPLVLNKALKKTNFPISKISLIALTVGPGLDPCLWAGVNFAKKLAEEFKLPIIPVNHIEGHIMASLVRLNSRFQKVEFKDLFPAICMIVSGGHTQLILSKKKGNYKIIGETRDDAAGECLDKTARILELGYPGGPVIAKFAQKCESVKIRLPRPMLHTKNYDFSFSGLKTAVLYDFKSRSKRTRQSKGYVHTMCAEIQQAVIDVLIKKTIKAAQDYKVKSIILGGGVTANKELKRQFKARIEKLPGLNLLLPDKELCTDNAAMTALAGYFNPKLLSWHKIKPDANLKIGQSL